MRNQPLKLSSYAVFPTYAAEIFLLRSPIPFCRSPHSPSVTTFPPMGLICTALFKLASSFPRGGRSPVE